MDTREKLLRKAELLFAERGFYGVSIAAISAELGLTKQALLHYFPTKEDLYDEVMRRLVEGDQAVLDHYIAQKLPPRETFEKVMIGLLPRNKVDGMRIQIVVRELMDNRRPAKKDEARHLEGLLQRLVKLLRKIPEWQHVSEAEAIIVVTQIVGAFSYFHISRGTKHSTMPPNVEKEIQDYFPGQYAVMIAALLDHPPSRPYEARPSTR